MNRTLIKNLKENIGQEVLVKGWVRNKRDHGKLTFIDLVDFSGKVQAVSTPKEAGHETAGKLRNEWVIEARALVNERPKKMLNPDEENGHIEIKLLEINILNEAENPPFEIDKDTSEVEETVRLKYRYLDLRTDRMQRNIKVRSEFVRRVREFLFKNDFTEIETPMLTKATPEGARDFVVPSRLSPGKFYALPQSPQQYKQLLMVAGFERYFQIARAMRDEDLRGDRGFEHTQIDLEMSFVSQKDVLNTIESMMIEVVEGMGKKIKEKPFPRFTYKETMEKYGDDKFDLRTKEEKKEGVLAYAWVVDFPFFERTEGPSTDSRQASAVRSEALPRPSVASGVGGAFGEGGAKEWTFTHNPFSMPKEEFIEDLLVGKNIENILAAQYDLVCNGFEAGGGSIRSHKKEILEAVYKIMGYSVEEIEKSVGHILEAFSYGVPPHGGIALGVERNIMNLSGEETLREVQAFPQSRKGQTSVMDAPSPIEKKQLDELGLSIKEKKEK
ncbi:hypothetical protein COV42_01055 [Candidatus Campbellbacteria bacterium CG11_big_fil_rev_8_21_14_0_20_44_21]|uniref:Aminoacyl-transfer RNA synthetases class-II family profile domain-containing protein n=1 Tax=Candidatus Campbellbacteria bacterium CG22_combo_CG10-13_8_21_14_all_43_18 TaxID=1974530 RepID=A0A2H0DY37_9BACT|nr:MAG: hypothetical protein COW82_00165 [Candidatus Campbellbacteria bacterium CG22_combo_CG10-13_8_21_14_all_43_18]PIR24383.1 MAG: hypothetical protein COV42_01055 [Candidatus Campbellbacteria bacterium CG11_big_fil_rev_8_21_14_0_20_44_21]